MYKAAINGKNFEITAGEQDHLIVNGQPIQWDIATIREGYFHILYNNKSYRAEVVSVDRQTKTCTLKINNKIQTVTLSDKFDLLLEKLGMNAAGSGKINSIKAPMPGLIIDLKVKEGDEVKANDPLLILEAMKMENILKSPGEGIVKSIKVKKGESVEKNQILIEF